MEIELMTTADGSHTLLNNNLNVTYHSKHGAIQESMHVFIRSGLHYMMGRKKRLSIFEMGFGTGLNALLSWIETKNNELIIDYTGIESNPLSLETIEKINYPEQLGSGEIAGVLKQMHATPFEEKILISENFSFTKVNNSLQSFKPENKFDLIYFDAFAPNTQPELWTPDVFEKMKGIMTEGACMVTYCSKSDVRRAMLAAGLSVSKLPGPPGKREMLRAENLPSSL